MDDLKVLIIGAGTKGALYPDERLTHAHAFSRNGFKLVGFCDTNLDQLEKASDRWGAPGYLHLESALIDCKPDIVTIAVSDSAHLEVLLAIVPFKPKLVFTEKPFCQNLREAQIVARMYQQMGIELSVNFSRRFLPKYQNLKIDPDRVLSCDLFYNKGIHNLCHFLDLMQLWGLDEVAPTEIDRPLLNVFEAEIYCLDQKISILNHGSLIRIVPTKPRDGFSVDSVLDYQNERVIHVDLSAAMELAAHNIKEHLLHGEPLISTVENALRVMEVCGQWQK